MIRQPIVKRPVQCPSCGYRALVRARRLQSGRPLRCGRCGRGYVPSAHSAQQPGGFTVDAQTLEDVRELLDQLLAEKHGSVESAEIVQQLEALIKDD